MPNAKRRILDRCRQRPVSAVRFDLKPVALLIASAFAACGAQASDVLPSAPSVVGGSASVHRSGTQQTVTQHSDRAVIDWGSFSVGRQNSVVFNQPSSASVMLNRVTGTDPSSILGQMSANGQVFLVNPNGVFFGAGARIDTGALVATTMSIANPDFMAGRFVFDRTGSGSIQNAGTITARSGGYVLLAADSVVNSASGRIDAPKGSVLLASADRVTIDPRADGLVGFSVEGNALRHVARVDNMGAISADGGQIALSARGARELTGMVVNNTGALRANAVEEQGGAIILSASSGSTQAGGSLSASGYQGGLIHVTNTGGAASVSGSVDVRGTAKGGGIVVAGSQTGLFSDASLDASGGEGGSVRVGGEFRGGTVAGVVSQQTYVAKSANIRADGTAGQGGSVVVWADDATRFDGAISARGAGAGSGGDAEVSGRQALAFNGQADLGSASGQSGTLLLDPSSITIKPGAAGSGSLDAAFGAAPGATILAATASAGDNGISTGTLVAVAGNTNILLEATGQITLADLASESKTLNLKQVGGQSVTLRSTTTGGINFASAADSIKTQGGAIVVQAQGSGTIDIGNLSTGAGAITLSAAGSGTNAIRTGNLTTTGNVSYNAPNGGVQQRTGTLIKAAAVQTTASIVNLDEKNEVAAFSAAGATSNIKFRSAKDLTVNAITLTGNAVALEVRSDKKMTVAAPVSAVGTGNTSVRLTSEEDMTVSANVTGQGSGTFGQVAALVAITSDVGFVKQTSGQIKAHDVGPKQVDATQLAHSGEVRIQAGKRAIDNKTGTGSGATVQTINVLAQSDGGRAQVSIDAPSGITSTGTISSLGASQPGITINTEIANSDGDLQSSGNVTLTGAALKVTQTAESGDPIKPDINLVKEGFGGVGIGGNDLNLGLITSDSTTASGFAYYGIATSSGRHTTFNNTVKTTAQAGIVAASRNADSLVQTAAGALLDAPVLGLSGGRDAGVFNVKTKVGAFTVQGAKAVDMDNSAYSGVLTIVALGRISDATKNPQTNEDIPATNKPIGGVRVKSENINLLSLDNRSTNTYKFDGTRTDNTATPRQDLVFIANVLDYLPGTIATVAKTNVQLMPFTASRNVQVVHTALDAPLANTTYYTGGTNGFLNQLHAESTVLFGGPGFSGNIDIGLSSDTGAQQIKLGKMELYFQTTGRVYNNYAANRDAPTYWTDNVGSAPYAVDQAALGCGLAAKPCLSDMTTGSLYIKDSLKQGAPADNRVRNVKITGSGSGTGGNTPPPAGPTSDGGNGGGGGAPSGGGGSGANNGSLPGGSNAPPTGSPGGGNTNTDPGATASTSAGNNPGQPSGNPGGTPGGPPADPSLPGGGSGQPDTAGTPVGDVLAGGGEFSGDSGGGPSGSDPAGGGTASGDPGSDPGAGDPAGGGVLSGDPVNPANPGGGDPGNPADPAGGGTASGDPPGGDPASGNPPGGDPSNGGPAGGGTASGDPAGGGTVSGDPAGDGTLAGDPSTGGGPSGGGVVSGDPSGGSDAGGGPAGPGTASGDPAGGGTLGGDTGGDGGTAGVNPGGTPGGSQGGSADGPPADGGGFAGGGSAGTPGSPGDADSGSFSDGSGSVPGQNQNPGGGDAGSGGFAGGADSGISTGSSGSGGTAPGGVFSDGGVAGGDAAGGQSGGGTAGGAGGASPNAGGGSGPAGGTPVADGGPGGTAGADGTSSVPGSAGSGAQGGSGADGSSTVNAGSGGGGGGGGGGQDGGFAGGASGGASGAADSGSQGSGGSAFADASSPNAAGSQDGGSAGGSQVGSAGDSQGGGNQGGATTGAGTGGGGSASASGDGSSASQGSNGSAASAPVQIGGSDGSSTSDSAGSSGGTAGGTADASRSGGFVGSASGGASGEATVAAFNTLAPEQNALPCEDQAETVRSVSKAGQPYSDLVQLKGSGMRLRSNENDASGQRPSCARKVSSK